MNFAKSVKIAAGIAAFAMMAAGPAMAKEVRIASEGAYPPFNFLDDKGEIAGFERDLGDGICKLAELSCTWVKNDWDSIIPNLVSGNYDMIMAGMSITAERDQVIDFSDEYKPVDASIYIGMEGSEIGLADATVAVQAGTIQAAHAGQNNKSVLEFPTADETIAALRNGEANAVLADGAYIKPFLEEKEFVIVDKAFIGGGVGIGLRESDGELKEKVNAAIATMKKDGSLNELLAKWFKEDTGLFE